MTPHRPRYTAPPLAPLPEPCEQPTRLAYELLDAHDDTARIATGQNLDAHWQAHLSYLRDLQRVGREVLAHAGQQEGGQIVAPADARTGEARRFRRFGRLPIRVRPEVAGHATPPNTKGGRR
jgi:hypothetical protein